MPSTSFIFAAAGAARVESVRAIKKQAANHVHQRRIDRCRGTGLGAPISGGVMIYKRASRMATK